MRKTKTIISGVLCLSLVLGMTACDQSEGGSGGGQTMATTQEDFTVDLGDITLDIEENTNIKGAVVDYLGSYDITKAGDVKPGVTYFEEQYGATVSCKIMGDSEIMDQLATLIQSGEAPDLVDQRENSFPYYIAQNTYMPIDEYMDLSAPQWKDVADIVESYAVGGKHYYYPWAYYMCSRVLCYNRNKLSEYGLDDPKELYDKGQWTWDEFRHIMEEFVSRASSELSEDIVPTGVYGSVGTCFIDTTGTPLVGFKDGQLVNNLNNANVDRAQTFLEDLKKQGLSKLDFSDLAYNNVATEPVKLGYAAFQSIGDWATGGYAKDMVNDPSLDYMFVPLPKDPQADRHYITMNTMAYLVPSGAKDVEAACVFINCMRLSKTDPAIQAVVKESTIKERKYNDEMWDMWSTLQNPSNFDTEALVTDFGYHLDSDTIDKVVSKICEDIPFVNNEELPTWTSARESFSGAFSSSIDAINADLKS